MNDEATFRPPNEFLAQSIALGIEFESSDVERLTRYLSLLLDANTRFNLTGITDPGEAWTRHILDSLTLVPTIVSSNAKRVIDVGSGGGLPGIPLAIVLPTLEITLLEATGKKARFLQEVAHDLGLLNVCVINDRAEGIGRQRQEGGQRERYDLAIARAVGKLPVLLELTVPLVKVGGHVLAMKGEKAAKEIADAKAAMHLLHCHVVQHVHTATGAIVVIEKQRKTPRIYPRLAGEPKRVPLGAHGAGEGS